MTMQKLIKNWSLPDRTQERTQLTLRLDFDLYAKLHALKEIYKTRSVNDMINDILKVGLEEIIQALPSYHIAEDEAIMEGYVDEYGRPPQGGLMTGPAIDFDSAYRRILNTKAPEETAKLEAVQ